MKILANPGLGPGESASFVRPREFMSFVPRHVTRSPPIGKRV